MNYKCIVLHFFYSEGNAFLAHSPLLFLFYPYTSLSLFAFQDFKTISMAPKRKLNRSATKFEKGETSRSPIQDTPTPTIPSPLNFLEVPKHWFENHTAFGRWIDTFKHRSLSYIDILFYNFFLFEDFEIISLFIQ